MVTRKSVTGFGVDGWQFSHLVAVVIAPHCRHGFGSGGNSFLSSPALLPQLVQERADGPSELVGLRVVHFVGESCVLVAEADEVALCSSLDFDAVGGEVCGVPAVVVGHAAYSWHVCLLCVCLCGVDELVG